MSAAEALQWITGNLPVLATAILVFLGVAIVWIAGRRIVRVSLRERPRMVNSGLQNLLAKRGNRSPGAFIDELGDRLRALDFDAELVRELTQAVVSAQGDESQALIDAIAGVLAQPEPTPPAWDLQGREGTLLLLVVGVNGSGKTTSCGKLAMRLRQKGLRVMLAAADTFRAGAIEQLVRWGQELDVPVYHKERNDDPASVVHDAFAQARSQGIDVLIADTSGRLDNKGDLMRQLGRIANVAAKVDPDAPHETFLVLDANTGKAAMRQAERFGEVVPLTGLVLTKLDGSASGGTLVSVHKKLGLPVRYLGTGERADSLIPFQARDFASSLVRETALDTDPPPQV